MTEYQFYNEIYGLHDESLLEECVSMTKKKFFNKGDIIVHAGETEPYVYFLIHGVCRGYITGKDGSETTDCFEYICGTVVRSCNHLAIDMPAMISIEALEESLYYTIPVVKVLELQKKYPEVGKLWIRLLSENSDKHLEAKRALQQYSMTERYQWFLRDYPGLIDRVNKKHVASFLDMDPATLSRLRRKEQKNNE